MPPKKRKLDEGVSQQVETENRNSAEQIKTFVREVETRKKIGAYVPVALRKLDEFSAKGIYFEELILDDEKTGYGRCTSGRCHDVADLRRTMLFALHDRKSFLSFNR